ncbi:Thioredoxin superfamily protein [Perilla frutescens var. hirtella]|uniref:Thioredoxin superfamily protein n=1 Tax=Perilla frutescens var. hirtella TaxID=608512 RepID=A0AAD4JHI2_PERFH|nr:Thioredoxin superfamily protein [Perilla frutescens var. hirtella]
MQQGLCHTCQSPASTAGCDGRAKSLVEENAVVVFAQRGCCMSYVVRRLLYAAGANPAVYEVEERDVDGLAGELATTGAAPRIQFPVVFIGGRWFGGPERVIATHITEELSPLLKQAGALWL